MIDNYGWILYADKVSGNDYDHRSQPDPGRMLYDYFTGPNE